MIKSKKVTQHFSDKYFRLRGEMFLPFFYTEIKNEQKVTNYKPNIKEGKNGNDSKEWLKRS